jgi:beta-mannosidase
MEVAETFASERQILSRGPDFEWHQKNQGGNRRIRKTLERYFPAPKDVPAELLLSQFQQAMAIQTAVDAWRSEQPRCMGTLFWQLNDNWPVASWSSIEYGGKWKPLQYLAKRFFEPVNVVVKPDASGADLVFGVNDTSEEVKGELTVEYWPYGGVSDGPTTSAWQKKTNVVLSPNASTKLMALDTPKNSLCGGTFAVLTLKTDKGVFTVDRHFHAYNHEWAKLGKPNLKAEVNGFNVTLTTDKPAFWVWMNAKGIRGEFDDNAVTLLPGQPRTFAFKAKDAVTPEMFKAAFSVTHLAELCKGENGLAH